jgi:hypothetical protein
MGRLVRLPRQLAAWAVIALWLPYVALNLIFSGPQITYLLGLALAALGLFLLRLSGVSLGECYVRVGPLSRQGALLLLLPVLVVVPAALFVGRLQPWHPLDDLVYAPVSALAQELYFRGGLLVALATVCRGRKRMALAADGALFGLWHLRAFTAVPILPAAGVIVVTTIAGLLWGLQVQRDRTILYAAAEHALILALV